MQAGQTQNETHISRQQLLQIVGLMFGTSVENPNTDEPRKPGPWDPVIREALEYVKVLGPHPEPWNEAFGPHPEPWRERFDAGRILRIIAHRFPQIWDAVGGGHSFDEVALNPQPLPPRYKFAESFAQVIIRRAELMRDMVANLRGETAEERGIIVVGGRDLLSTVDEYCGTGFRLNRPRPHPPWWNEEFDTLCYLLMAAQFERALRETVYDDLRHDFHEAAAKLVDAGLARLQ